LGINIIPVILAGGSGTRLWPMSRESYPKQFLRLIHQHSLLQETVLRIKHIPHMTRPLIICNTEHYFLCQEQLKEIEIEHASFILEPFGRNTAPAIGLAAKYVEEYYGPQSILLILPSDHLISDIKSFSTAVSTAIDAAKQGFLATFGIKPTSPKTGYGYIESGALIDKDIYQTKRFIEKPDLETAQQFLAEENFFWNSGMFVFNAQTYLSELENLTPQIAQAVTQTYLTSERKIDFLRLDPTSFEKCENMSIDYAVMEKTQRSVVIPLASSWNDLGCWTSVAEAGDRDEKNNVIRGQVLALDSENCFITSDDRLVAAIGLKNQIIVSTKDAVLVADKAYSQEVKYLVNQLKTTNNNLTTHHQKVERPWGYYEDLVVQETFQVRHVMLNPHAKLSLQLHHHRTEHWVVLSGEAKVINGEETLYLSANQSTYIPKIAKHQLANAGTEPLHVIEVQTGILLGEKDIIRFEYEGYGEAVRWRGID
jgi:mannose-1-phosphate guanylyltransferase/mannose-6-phosphate isomerase